MTNCIHKNKKVTDGWNVDGEIYYTCSDCGYGWRQEPETEDDKRVADEVTNIDKEALDL